MKAKQTQQKEIGRYSVIENTLEGYLKADQAAEAKYQAVLWRDLLTFL